MKKRKESRATILYSVYWIVICIFFCWLWLYTISPSITFQINRCTYCDIHEETFIFVSFFNILCKDMSLIKNNLIMKQLNSWFRCRYKCCDIPNNSVIPNGYHYLPPQIWNKLKKIYSFQVKQLIQILKHHFIQNMYINIKEHHSKHMSGIDLEIKY